jgi:nicotinamide phosphoribosyltransferase
MKNILLATDVYKLGHMEQYKTGVTKVYSYLTARSDKNFDRTVFFGLQYYLDRYLSQPITPEMGEEMLEYRKRILGSNSTVVEEKIRSLCQLGYWPIQIKAVPEGTIMPVQNVLMTITNTHPDFYWTVGYVESILLKLWYSITVASCVHTYRGIVESAFEKTVDDNMHFLMDYMVHDFGYRGDSSEEGAQISGAAHLISFLGSDTVSTFPFLVEYYDADIDSPVMASVPASEHSVMCSFDRGGELDAFHHMLDTYPSGIVSIVSDTFDVYRVLTEFAEVLKPKILSRDGKVVFRPDSGDPETIICGTIEYFNSMEHLRTEYTKKFVEETTVRDFRVVAYLKDVGEYREVTVRPFYYQSNGVLKVKPPTFHAKESYTPSPEEFGSIVLLDRMFGSTVNEKGYKVLNPKVGLIYGDGMYIERYQRTLNRLEKMGYSASNLVIGVGGILRNHSRDTMGFAIKATYVEIDGVPCPIEKDPVTDSKKKSAKGLLSLRKYADTYITLDNQTEEGEKDGELLKIFEDGNILVRHSLQEIRDRVKTYYRK